MSGDMLLVGQIISNLVVVVVQQFSNLVPGA